MYIFSKDVVLCYIFVLLFIALAPQEKYFLLTDFLPEDFKLRNKLNTQKIVSFF